MASMAMSNNHRVYLVGGNNKYQPINQPLLLMITPIIGWLNSLYNLVGGWATPLKNMSSSVGMMTFPIYEKKHVPNHQPVYVLEWK